jgi:hypothetical protein
MYVFNHSLRVALVRLVIIHSLLSPLSPTSHPPRQLTATTALPVTFSPPLAASNAQKNLQVTTTSRYPPTRARHSSRLPLSPNAPTTLTPTHPSTTAFYRPSNQPSMSKPIRSAMSRRTSSPITTARYYVGLSRIKNSKLLVEPEAFSRTLLPVKVQGINVSGMYWGVCSNICACDQPVRTSTPLP